MKTKEEAELQQAVRMISEMRREVENAGLGELKFRGVPISAFSRKQLITILSHQSMKVAERLNRI